jgi:hypothetical protein
MLVDGGESRPFSGEYLVKILQFLIRVWRGGLKEDTYGQQILVCPTPPQASNG